MNLEYINDHMEGEEKKEEQKCRSKQWAKIGSRLCPTKIRVAK